MSPALPFDAPLDAPIDSRSTPGRPEPRLPAALVSPVGFLATLTAAAVLESLSRQLTSGDDLAVMAAVVALLGWWSQWRGALICAGLGWLMLNGFVTDRYGELRWHGTADALRLAVLLGCAVVAVGLHAAEARRRRRWRRWSPGAEARSSSHGWTAGARAMPGGRDA